MIKILRENNVAIIGEDFKIMPKESLYKTVMSGVGIGYLKKLLSTRYSLETRTYLIMFLMSGYYQVRDAGNISVVEENIRNHKFLSPTKEHRWS